MSIVTRLASRDNFRQVEEEWQYEFVIYVLSNLGIPEEILQNCFPENLSDFTVQHKIELRAKLKTFDINIVDDRDGGLQIFVRTEKNQELENVLVAEWKKCRFVYRQDPKEVDPAKKIYIEIVAEPWVIFDNG